MKARFPHPGEVFEGKYEVEAILGSGGFARVYRAVETGLDRKVALKILRPRIDDEQSNSQRDSYLETVMQRFRREARLLSQLRSSNTITMHHYGKTEEGLLYMVLEYIDGLSLAELMRAGKPLPPKRVATILEQVLNSLHEAHMLGMLHRDLKPANIMIYEHLGNRDNVKLLDFGIAKLVKDANIDKDLTGDGTLVGTPRYMAPEQIRGDVEVGPSADVYALGLVAYELLVGERAIEADSSIKIIGKQLSPDSFLLPVDIDCPPRLRRIIDKMLQKDTSARYESAQEVIDALRDPDLLSEDIEELSVEALDAVDGILAVGSDGEIDDGYEELDLNDPSIEELSGDAISASSAQLASLDRSTEGPLPDSVDPSFTGDESIDTSFSGLAGDRRRPVILAGVVFLVVVVLLLGVVFMGGDKDETAHAEPNGTTTPDAGRAELAANDTTADAGSETDPESESLELATDEIPSMVTVFKSNYDETEIFVNGESRGIAPVEVEEFPARIKAVHKGRTQALHFPQSPGPEITIEFPEYKPPKTSSRDKNTGGKKKPDTKYVPIPY
jgi:serine/threonine protein kinase